MTVTASFIGGNWNLHKKVISFFMVKGHKGEDIRKNLVKCLAEWGLERVLTVTVDNASSNDNTSSASVFPVSSSISNLKWFSASSDTV